MMWTYNVVLLKILLPLLALHTLPYWANMVVAIDTMVPYSVAMPHTVAWKIHLMFQLRMSYHKILPIRYESSSSPLDYIAFDTLLKEIANLDMVMDRRAKCTHEMRKSTHFAKIIALCLQSLCFHAMVFLMVS